MRGVLGSNERGLLTGRHHVPWRSGRVSVAGNGSQYLMGASVSRSLTGPARRHAEEEAGPAPLLLLLRLLHRRYDVHESQCRRCIGCPRAAASTATPGGVEWSLLDAVRQPIAPDAQPSSGTWDENDVTASVLASLRLHMPPPSRVPKA